MTQDIITAMGAMLNGEAVAPLAEPWLGWLLICLCRQRVRQTWLVSVKEQHLGDVDSWTGNVPGLMEWQYRFHGAGLCLSGPNHEELDVDFFEADGATIDPYFFTHRVLSLNPTPYPETQLRQWFSGENMLISGLNVLHDRTLIAHPKSAHRFRLSSGWTNFTLGSLR